MNHLKMKISDQPLLDLIQKYLKQDIVDNLVLWTPTAGTPQGAVLSPLLANIYLHPLDIMLTRSGYKMVRYADDFVILCKSEKEARDALLKVKEWIAQANLTLHPDKTHIGNSLVKGEGFEFLGYMFESKKRYVRKKSLKSFRDKVKEKTKRTRSGSLNEIISDLNPLLRGWFEYFKHAYSPTFKGNDGFVRRRLRAILLKRNKKRRSFGRNINAHRRYPNIYFAKLGLFTSYEAWVTASQSR
jgi:RNA-directed DNA polymerase